MNEELFEQLRAYDRKSTDQLRPLIDKFASAADYASALIDLSASEPPQIACGATWMLRAHVESHGALSPEHTRSLIAQLARITVWDAQLHICQTINKLEILTGGEDALFAWLEPLLQHKRPFVRAWSLDALCALASQHNAFLPNAARALQQASDDPAASVRARARNLQKTFQH